MATIPFLIVGTHTILSDIDSFKAKNAFGPNSNLYGTQAKINGKYENILYISDKARADIGLEQHHLFWTNFKLQRKKAESLMAETTENTRKFKSAMEITGIPVIHQQVFQEVANNTKCIIMNRTVGKLCTTLIENGYSTKGFHIKAKSCDWGPASGFVTADPKLTKLPVKDQNKQEDDLKKAFNDHKAGLTPICISRARVKELEAYGQLVIKDDGDLDNSEQIFVTAKSSGHDVVTGRTAEYVLKKTKDQRKDEMWELHYAKKNELPDYKKYINPNDQSLNERTKNHLKSLLDQISKNETAVFAMVNPDIGDVDDGIATDPMKQAITGDYDLFSIAVWHEDYSPADVEERNGLDTRKADTRVVEKAILDGSKTPEDENLGNVSPRHKKIRQELNQGFKKAGYTGGNMVHHSDEAGRPFVKDIDFPVFAVVPNERSHYILQSVDDLREFFSKHNQYVPFMNKGWMGQLTGIVSHRVV